MKTGVFPFSEPLIRYDDPPLFPQVEPIDLGLAQLARHRNPTLDAHLPPRLPEHLQHADEKAVAVLGAENCIRRINWRDPEDVLEERDFARVVKDLLEEVCWIAPGEIFSEICEWRKQGYLLPYYLVKAGTQNYPLSTGGVVNTVYSEEGILLERNWETPSPIQRYRDNGHLIENVRSLDSSSRDSETYAPLYAFWQIQQAVELYRRIHVDIDTSRITGEIYATWLRGTKPGQKKFLRATGDPKFPGGRPELLPEERINNRSEDTRKAQQDFRNRSRVRKKNLEKKVLQARAQGIPCAALTEALKSSHGPTRKDAERVQQKILDRKL